MYDEDVLDGLRNQVSMKLNVLVLGLLCWTEFGLRNQIPRFLNEVPHF